jgi:O-Antigen ligase
LTVGDALGRPNSNVTFLGLSLQQFQRITVWIMLASSFFVIVEPAPSDLLFVFVVACFLSSGLRISSAIAPLLLFLLFYNLGAFLSYLQIVEDPKARMFVITSTYMAVSAVFFAFYVADDPVPRMALIKNALVVAAFIAAALALMGMANIAGLASVFTLYGRAVGTFKDPNVFATFLLLPGVMLVQGFLLGTQRHKLISVVGLFVILGGLFFAFSRGAWISFIFASAMMTGLTFILSPSKHMRSRIIFITILGVIGIAVLITLLLSVDEIRNQFLDRFTLVKSYDAGETGRFGNQLNSIPLLLQSPLGFGPFQFHLIFGLDPHNAYINAFSSYGWMGGISYFLLVITTVIIGFRSVLMRTPWQNAAIVVFCPLFTTLCQGVQIDTDHWRHLYLMLGLTWGLYAASLAYVPARHENSQTAQY